LIKGSSLAALVVAFTAGIVFWGGFNWSLELANTEQFCISCHEMNDNIVPEYQASVHFLNSSGVRATCPDCHVPDQWFPKVVRKVGAVNELYHKMVGSIDTKEKFRLKRGELAQHVWGFMRANGSQECRNCHEFNSMLISEQKPDARLRHQYGKKNKLSCIDCHIGIAHELPKSLLDVEHQRFKETEFPCGACHVSMALPVEQEEWGW